MACYGMLLLSALLLESTILSLTLLVAGNMKACTFPKNHKITCVVFNATPTPKPCSTLMQGLLKTSMSLVVSSFISKGFHHFEVAIAILAPAHKWCKLNILRRIMESNFYDNPEKNLVFRVRVMCVPRVAPGCPHDFPTTSSHKPCGNLAYDICGLLYGARLSRHFSRLRHFMP